MQSMEELSRVHVIGDAPYRELIVCNLDSSDIMLTLQGLKLHLLHTSTSSMSAASVQLIGQLSKDTILNIVSPML